MTKGELFKYQDSLPSLPVPKLAETLTLFKETIKPYYPNGANDVEFLKYCEKIDDFANSNEGVKLQLKLEEFAIDKRNWLSHFWDNYAYLDYRDPVSPFVSYFFHHKDFNTRIGNDQILKATAIATNVLKFMTSVENETLEPELVKNAPFCMEGFKWMFNNSRVPSDSRDINVTFDSKENRFMLIISNNYIYKLQTHDETTDQILSFNQLYNGIKLIRDDSLNKGKNENPIGILTSSNRDEWSKNFKVLENISIKNQINLNEIFKSSFVICLDDNLPKTIESKSRNAWHGNGTNRWFDKPIQFLISKNGGSGFLGEHSKMDGTPNARLNDWLVKQFSNMKVKDDDLAVVAPPKIEELTFDVNNEITEAIKTETDVFNKTVNSLAINTWQYFGFGKDDIKLFKASPDSFVQMLIQLAYYKYTGTLRPTYESASTRKYFKGRTETCRSVSIEALNFVKDWENTSLSNEQKIASFRNAIKAHGNYIKLASSGFGVDRHLFGLKQMLDDSTKNSKVVTDFFNNPVLNYSQHWYLSTSQLSSENFNGWGFAPVVPEGFGFAYMINKNWLHINITNYKENAFNLNVDEMAYYLTVSLHELKDALSKEQIKAKL